MKPDNDRRTHTPAAIRDRIKHYAGLPHPAEVSTGHRGIIVKHLNELCGTAVARRFMLRYLTGGEKLGLLTEMSAHELTGQEINGIFKWLGSHVPTRPADDPEFGKWEIRSGVKVEVSWLLAEIEKLECVEAQLSFPFVAQEDVPEDVVTNGAVQTAMKLGGRLRCGKCGVPLRDSAVCSNPYCKEANEIPGKTPKDDGTEEYLKAEAEWGNDPCWDEGRTI